MICSKCAVDKPESEFYANTRRCKVCQRAYQKDYYAQNAAQRREYARGRYASYTDRKKAERKVYKEKYPERVRESARRDHLQRRFRLTEEAYEALLLSQGGVCGLCGSPPGRTRLAVDHDHTCCSGHKTCGECIRGLLCSNCNRSMGWFEKFATAATEWETRRATVQTM